MSQPDRIPQIFRDHFARHNREALLLTLLTFAAAILLWTACYVIAHGIVLLTMTAIWGGDARIPLAFPIVFGVCALLLCLLAWAFRKIHPPWLLADNKSAFEIFMDIILMIPRITFEIWGNFSAFQFPTERELRASWRLIHTMGEQGKISIYELPLLIPKPRLRERVVFLLQLVGLIELQRHDDGLWLALRGKTARNLAKYKVKIDPELPREDAG